MQIKLKGDIKESNYISIMQVLFQYINTDKDNTIIYRLDYSNTPLSHLKNLHITCYKTKTQYVAYVSEC